MKTKTIKTPLLRLRLPSLMLRLYAFPGKQASRQKPPATSSPLWGYNLSKGKNLGSLSLKNRWNSESHHVCMFGRVATEENEVNSLAIESIRLQAMIWFETIKKWFFSEAKLSGVFACRGIEPTLVGVTSGVAMACKLAYKARAIALDTKAQRASIPLKVFLRFLLIE